MSQSLHRFLLDRIAALARPVFTGKDLADFPEIELTLWLDTGILCQASVPKTIRRACDDGIERDLEVVPDGDQFLGIALDPEEWVPPVPLTHLDLSSWAFSPSAFAKAIVQANGLLEIPFETPGPLLCVGEADDGPVFLVQPIPDREQLVHRCTELSRNQAGEPAVVLLPGPVFLPPSVRRRLADDGITIAILGRDAAQPLLLQIPRKRPEPPYLIEFDGKEWTFVFEGKKSVVKDSDAARFVVLTILRQGKEISNLEIWKTVVPPANPADFEKLLAAGIGAGIEKTNFRSIRHAEDHLENIETALITAKESGKRDLVDRLEDELEKTEDYLRKNRGKDGKSRKTSTIHDTARATVSRGIKICREDLARQEFGGGPLSRHLLAALVPASDGHRIYNPSPRIDWAKKNIPKNLL